MENTVSHPMTPSAPTRRPSALQVVAPGVAWLPLSIANVYLIGEPGGGDRSWVLVDAGLVFSAEAIARAAAERFGPTARPAAIVLTHGHFDHVGALPQLADRWDAPVYAHHLELPYLTGQSAYPPPDPAVGGGALAFLSRLYPRGPIDLGGRVRPLPPGELPAMAGWRWIHTPGHSPGHISLLRDADRALIVGDAFVTTVQESALAVLRRRQAVHRPPAYYTSNWQAARESIHTLAGLQPDVAATGHGAPMHGDRMRAELAELLANWDRVSLPRHGRYVRQPAVANDQGVVSVPPAVADPHLQTLALVGIAVALGSVLLGGGPRRRRRRADW